MLFLIFIAPWKTNFWAHSHKGEQKKEDKSVTISSATDESMSRQHKKQYTHIFFVAKYFISFILSIMYLQLVTTNFCFVLLFQIEGKCERNFPQNNCCGGLKKNLLGEIHQLCTKEYTILFYCSMKKLVYGKFSWFSSILIFDCFCFFSIENPFWNFVVNIKNIYIKYKLPTCVCK